MISYQDFCTGAAMRILIFPDSELSRESFETLCKKHIKDPDAVAMADNEADAKRDMGPL